MPLYSFQHPITGEIREIFFRMKDNKVFIDEDSVEWNRLFCAPQLGFDTKIDPFSKKAFLEKTQKGGTIGDLFDLSKEMSEKRGGKKNDPIKKEFAKSWKKKRGQA